MAASSLRLISCGNRASLARIFKPNNIIIALSSVAIHSKSLFSMPPLTLTRPFPSACICRNISGQRAFFSTERHWADVYLEEMKEIANNDSTKLIDVREPWELEKFGHFENAVNIPLGEVCKALVLSSEEFEEKYGQQKPDPSDDNILFYCMAGIRSRYAMNAAHTLGYEKARHYIGGWKEWSEKAL